jgi:hypothetical protein
VKLSRSPGKKTGRVRVRVSPAAVGRHRHPTLTIKNIGDTVIRFGEMYEVQRRAGGKWAETPSHAFTLELLMMEPGASAFAERVWTPGKDQNPKPWQPGTYRVVKQIGMGTRPRRKVYAKVVFRVP